MSTKTKPVGYDRFVELFNCQPTKEEIVKVHCKCGYHGKIVRLDSIVYCPNCGKPQD